MRVICHALFVVAILLAFSAARAEEASPGTDGFDIWHLDEALAAALIGEGAGDVLQINRLRLSDAASGKLVTLNDIGERKTVFTPNAPAEIRAMKIDSRARRFTATVAEKESGRALNVQGYYSPVAEMPVPARKISRGETISDADITMAPVASQRTRKDMLLEPSDLVGKEALRTLMPDKPVSRRDLRAPLVVQRGGAVPLLYRSDYIELKTSGQALDNASAGALVRVRNEKSGVVVQGMADASGAVIVNYDGAALGNNIVMGAAE